MCSSDLDRPLTFIVRLFARGEGGVRGVVERVRTGQKEPIESVEDVARVLTAAFDKEDPMSLASTRWSPEARGASGAGSR